MEILAPPCYVKKPEGVKKMYLSPINIRYVKSQIVYAVNGVVTKDTSGQPLFQITKEQLGFIDDFMHNQIIRETGRSPIEELHKLNKHIIINTAKQIVEEPNMLNENYDKEWGLMPRGNWEYTEYSFRGDTWHPEDLFMESGANRNNAYWKPLEVRFNPSENKWRNTYGYDFNPNEIYKRHYDTIENNTEDRRVQVPRRLFY